MKGNGIFVLASTRTAPQKQLPLSTDALFPGISTLCKALVVSIEPLRASEKIALMFAGYSKPEPFLLRSFMDCMDAQLRDLARTQSPLAKIRKGWQLLAPALLWILARPPLQRETLTLGLLKISAFLHQRIRCCAQSFGMSAAQIPCLRSG
jgi:hypothetical protein